MIPDLQIEQALLTADARGVRIVARTEGFDPLEAERIAVLFGSRPAGVPCPLAHFACPFGKKSVAIGTVADRPDGSLGFRFLVMGRDLYRNLGDPFAIAERFPPDWNAKGTLPNLDWLPESLPNRRVEDLQEILKTGDTSLLLGGTQALVDGGSVALKRSEPAEVFLRGLWNLLPDRTRVDLWPASFAFSNELGFHAAILPELPEDSSGVRLTEEGLRDYPQCRYELHLQIAIESGDQRELDRLFARRTDGDSLRLWLKIIAMAIALAVIFKFVL